MKSMARIYVIMGLVVAVVLGGYFALPFFRSSESVFPLLNGATVIAYDDKSDLGNSEIEFAQNDSVLDFSCTLGKDSLHGGWCGLLFDLTNPSEKTFRKWNFVDQLTLDVESSGTDEILLKIWTYDPKISDLKNPKSFRLLLKEVKLAGGRQTVSIPLDEFYTPDFWYDGVGKNVDRNQRSLESAARLEITSGWNQPRGKKYSLTIRGIAVSGTSTLAFGIILGVFILVVIGASGIRFAGKNHCGSPDEK